MPKFYTSGILLITNQKKFVKSNFQFLAPKGAKLAPKCTYPFHAWIAFIKLLFKLEYKFIPMNDNQDGRQNGRRLSICFCGQSTLIIYYPITPKSHTWITFIKLSVCLMTKMAAKMAVTYQFTLLASLA